MLCLMHKRLDTWGMLAAIILGTVSPACAEAQARPAAHPSSTQYEEPSPLDSFQHDGDFDDASDADIDEDGALGSASSELESYDVAIDTSPYELSADYDLAVDQDPSAMTEFQEVLAPYGTWADDAVYGTVWVPEPAVVGSDFAPYVTAGHWALTEDDEWLWVSDYDWGWAPFHYGRWVWISGRGWAWIPGRVYAPAWVVWRTGYYDDYYLGWAPMPPTWYWRGGIAVSLWAVPPAPYVFCSSRHILRPHVRRHVVPATHVSAVASHTRPYYAATPTGRRNFASYVRGPSVREARLPARVVPRASHDPRAISRAKPVPGGRVGRVTKLPAQSRTLAPQPGTSFSSPQPAHPGVGRPSAPTSPRPVTPRTPTPRITTTPAPRAPSYTPAPPVAPRAPTSPRPVPAPAPRTVPVPSPRVSPPPQSKPTPRVTPAPMRPSPAPRTVRPSPPSGRQGPVMRQGPSKGGRQ